MEQKEKTHVERVYAIHFCSIVRVLLACFGLHTVQLQVDK